MDSSSIFMPLTKSLWSVYQKITRKRREEEEEEEEPLHIRVRGYVEKGKEEEEG